uniref:LRAT domain-containing protein n=1 Tax=Equus asinus TaxID=9793 RepID=A0A9L0K1E3_EQUAS
CGVVFKECQKESESESLDFGIKADAGAAEPQSPGTPWLRLPVPGCGGTSKSDSRLRTSEGPGAPPATLGSHQFCVEPEPGDLIEIFRIGYEHWAIYVGGGDVIHLAPPSEYPGAGSSSIFSILSSRAVVKQEPLRDVAGGCRYRVNNYLDHKYRPQPVNKIIGAAKEKIGEEIEYSVLSRNCEHFVTELRYGAASSRQVKQVVIGGEVTLGLGILGVIGYSLLKKRYQNQ